MTKRKAPSVPPAIRVAIYCRQSVARDLEFGSIEAQREAVEAYVASQRGEGWVALPDRYDDHGFSGGNTDRPAFQRLVADVEAGKVDVVAAYKIDRVSRSLGDFTNFMGMLERLGVGFVSTTQNFDTRSSMGRLTLNILASASPSSNGKSSASGPGTRSWPAGAVDPGPVAVRCWAILLRIKPWWSIRPRPRWCAPSSRSTSSRAVWSPRWRSWNGAASETSPGSPKNGRQAGGAVFNKGTLRKLLTNPLYIGKVRCGDEVVEGRHDAIIEPGLVRRGGSGPKGPPTQHPDAGQVGSDPLRASPVPVWRRHVPRGQCPG